MLFLNPLQLFWSLHSDGISFPVWLFTTSNCEGRPRALRYQHRFSAIYGIFLSTALCISMLSIPSSPTLLQNGGWLAVSSVGRSFPYLHGTKVGHQKWSNEDHKKKKYHACNDICYLCLFFALSLGCLFCCFGHFDWPNHFQVLDKMDLNEDGQEFALAFLCLKHRALRCDNSLRFHGGRG